jgi:hypothetical protein
MNEAKPWYLSMGVWGAVVVIGATAIQMAGYILPTDDTNALVAKTLDWITTGIQIVGGWAALYGRVRATKKVG